MKIGSKLTLRYVGATAVVFSLFVLAVYLFSRHIRERTFFNYLTYEAVTKANLFLSKRAEPTVMQAIYANNRRFLTEPEVAIYTLDFRPIYHDAKGESIVKETPQLLEEIVRRNEMDFYVGQSQAIGMVYSYGGTEYIVTAAAYAKYGYVRLKQISLLLFFSWLCGLGILTVIGWLLSRSALSPINRIIREADAITGSNLTARLEVENPDDELGALSATFNEMLDRLEKSFDDQKLFVGHVAHELRTPLAALIAELDVSLLRAERSGAEYRAVIGNALDDARRLRRLIGDLLDLAKADYRPEQIVMKEIRLDELLLDARASVLKMFPDYRVELIFDLEAEDERKIMVLGNEYLLKIAFMNLIENNCKFSENHISHIRIASHGRNSVICFSDTGIGISDESMAKIFTPFYRGENASSAKGHGLGMPLAQKIVKLHGGTLTVESQTGKGTIFTVEIPHL